MSDYSVIAQVSETLRGILWRAFADEAVIRDFVTTEETITFTNPTETARDSANRLSLWLYQVTENEFVKNQPPRRIAERDGNGTNSRTLMQPPPMALNLYYLVTPFAPQGQGNHLLLGKTLQVMYDNGVVHLHDNTGQVREELRISFCRLTLEELTRIWEALRESYRLSVCYQVRVTHIDSTRETVQARVAVRDIYGGERSEVEQQLRR